jgi:Ca2+-binding EF-hand superfamily protein
MKKSCGFSMLLFLTLMLLISGVALSHAAGIPEEMIKNAFQQAMTGADSNKDGKLTVKECVAIHKSKKDGEKKCKFWDTNKDGIISEAEYISQVKNIGKK